MNLNDIKQALLPIKQKIFLLLGRSILTSVDNSETTMKVQVSGLSGETISDIERIEDFGFSSHPPVGAEAMVGFINGNRDQGLVFKIHDKRYRPTNLGEGESIMYHLNNTSHVKVKDGMVEITGGGTLEFAVKSSKMKLIIDAIINAYNTHVHISAAPGNPSSVPTVLLTSPPLTDYQSTEVKIS